MFQSPLKTVTEKLKPTQSKSSISSLKFERPSDFKKFIGFIKNETKELEKIKLPTRAEVEPKSKSGGFGGLLALGLFGGLGAAFGGQKEDGNANLRVGSAGGTSAQFNKGLLLTANLRKNKKNLGLSGGTKSVTKQPIKTVKTKTQQRRQKIKIKKEVLRKRFREKRIDAKIEKNNKIFKKTFNFIKKKILKNARIQLGLEYALEDFEVQQILDQDMGFAPGEMDRALAEEIQEHFEKRGRKFIDPNDAMARKAVSSRIGFFDLLKKVEEPITLKDAQMMENLRDNIGGATSGMSVDDKMIAMRAASEAEELLKLPEFKKLLKEDKFQKITGVYTPEAKKMFGFKPKYALDDLFTGMGEKTRDFRAGLLKTIRNNKIPFTGKGGKLLMKFGGKIAMPLDIGLAAITQPFELGVIENRGTFLQPKIRVGRDNIVTTLYDAFTAAYNISPFGSDLANKRLFITKSKDPRIRQATDAKNKAILEARRLKQMFNFDQSIGTNFSPDMQLPKSNVFASQKTDGAEFVIPFDYSTSGIYDFNFPIYQKLFKQ